MNTRLFTLLFSFICFTKLVSAQKGEPVIAKVTYRFSHVKDTNNLNYPTVETMVLLIGKNSSAYRSLDKMIFDSTFLKAKHADHSVSMPPGYKPTLATVNYFSSTEKKAYQQDFLVKNYLYPIEYPAIKWKITRDTLTISGQKCQKAVGAWKGRIYTAWFCPDIPFKAGPWKLIGLPGLVLRASDQKKQVMFEFTGLQKYTGPLTTDFDKDIVQVSHEQYLKLKEAFEEDPIAFVKSQMPQITSIQTSAPYKRKRGINNPLELVK